MPSPLNSLLAAGWGPLIPFVIFFVFITLSLLHAAWKRSQRSEGGDPEGWGRPQRPLEEGEEVDGGTVVRRYLRTEPAPVPPPLPEATAPRPLSPWELELERVLGSESRTAPAPASPPPAPPPLPTHWESPGAEHSVEELTSMDLESAGMPSAPLATLAPAETAYGHASSLQLRVRDFLHQVDARVSRHVPVLPTPRPVRPAELSTFVAGLRTHASARQAILAAVVLGPPKSLES